MNILYDVVVIGAGSGGLTASIGFAKIGKRVLLIEKNQMGGECTNAGCIPSKALLHRSKEFHNALSVTGSSAKAKRYRDASLQYVRDTIEAIREEESIDTLERHGVEVALGEAEFTGPCTLEVGGIHYQYTQAVIATGSSPRLLTIEEINQKDLLTNQNIFDLEKVPERLLVIGSGPIGMEMGQAFAMLGSTVTIATIDHHFAKLEDPAISSMIERSFKDLGITIIKSAHLKKVVNRQATFSITPPAGRESEKNIVYDKILVAIGRVPNLPKGLTEAGVEYTKYGINTNERYRTTNKHVFAIGDVAHQLKFTHTANDQARELVTQTGSKGILRIKPDKSVPKVTYIKPEVASVGLSLEEATEFYGKEAVTRIEIPYAQSDRARTDEETNGVLIVYAKKLSGRVLGANIYGHVAGELISLFTLAIDTKISLYRLRSLIYAYPTYATLLQKAGDQFLSNQISTLKDDLFFLVKKHTPKIIAGMFWISLIGYFTYYRISNDLSYIDVLLNLIDFFTTSMWGPITYILAYALRPLILFPATLLTILSGILFGFWFGIIYTLIGENMSANLAYWIGRFFGKDLKLEQSFLKKWVIWLRHRPFESVLFMRLFYVPFDLTNYGSGVLKVSWPGYALATLIGTLPGLTTFVALGASIDLDELRLKGLSVEIFDPLYLLASVVIFTISLGFSRYLKNKKRLKTVS